MRYESTELGQVLAASAENDELELPNASSYTAKDYAIAIDGYLNWLHDNAIAALGNGEPGELRAMAKFLKRHCDMSRCFAMALPDDDIFCQKHRAEEDAIIVQYPADTSEFDAHKPDWMPGDGAGA